MANDDHDTTRGSSTSTSSSSGGSNLDASPPLVSAKSSSPTTTTTTTTNAKPRVDFEDPDAHPTITLLDGLRILVGLALLSGLLSYFVTGNSVVWGYNAWWTQPKAVAASLVS